MARAAVMPRAAFPGNPVDRPPYPGALSRPSLRGARDATAVLMASVMCGERFAPPRAPPAGARRDTAACRPLRRDSMQRNPQSGYSIPAPPPPQRGRSKSRPSPRHPAMAARISRPPAPPSSRLAGAISCPDAEAWRHVTPNIHRAYLIPLASHG